jgi:hypothetical protein
LENTDHRPFKKKFDVSQQNTSHQNDSGESDEINKTIAHFNIDINFNIVRFFDKTQESESNTNNNNGGNSLEKTFKWSLSISNVQKKKNVNKYFILVAVSRIDVGKDMNGNVNEDMKGTKKNNDDCNIGKLDKKEYKHFQEQENCQLKISIQSVSTKKGIAIYNLELKEEKKNYSLNKNTSVTYYYSDSISGICRFVEEEIVDQSQSLKRFIILNYHGIYSYEISDSCDFFNFNDKFEYPSSIKRKLIDSNHCFDILLSCIFNKYFLVTQYKNCVQPLEGKRLKKTMISLFV